MKVYIFFADGFEETEALCPWDLLKRAGADVTTVSINADRKVKGSHGLIMTTDICTSRLPETPEGDIMVVLPGGMPGASNLDGDKYVDKYVKYASENGHLAAICAAPFILGKRGLLAQKAATCFPGFEKDLFGAAITQKKVVTHGNITTAKGMGVAFEFGLELIRVLFGEEKAAEIKVQVQA